ncbi:MAG TPA: SUMF1/EgtB/PvdO family nonheme iron enzyme [Polyangiaceae bacterium]|nr:SUMF1/EgtB/PvdO family nonheme iron enzyme [Polyangiaceae bacterium]
MQPHHPPSPAPNRRRRTALFVALFSVGGLLVLGGGLLGRALIQPSDGGFLHFAGQTPRNEWRSVDKKHWQAVAAAGTIEATDITDAREKNRGACGPGMVEVSGRYKLDADGKDSSGGVEELQNSACVDWISKEFPARCKTFDRPGWLDLSQKLPTKPLRYCMDRFEYPNKKGENPIIVVTYNESTALCKAAGKRLCNETEWTFACEGEEAVPYPYGYERDAEACNVDRPWKPFAENGLAPRDGQKARAELDRLWQGQPSGASPKCKSPFGLYDMTGNVDEWTKTTRTSGGFASVLKGGYWGPVRARCRPATRAHNENFVAYQQSFRCCSDAPASTTTGLADAGSGPDAGPDAGPAEPQPAGVRLVPVPQEARRSVEVDDQDEQEELAKKVGLQCGVRAVGDVGDVGDAGAFAAFAVATALGARRLRRRSAG